MSSTPGTERTIDPGDTLHAEPLQVAGQLNLAGEAQITPADVSAAGVAAATPQPELPIPPTEALTIGPRSSREGEPVEIGGQLNIAGQLEAAPGGSTLSVAAEPIASGTAEATGTASADTELLLASAGVADATGAGAVSLTRTFAATGVGDTTKSAAVSATRTITAAGSGSTFASAVGSIDRQFSGTGEVTASGSGVAPTRRRSIIAAGISTTAAGSVVSVVRSVIASGATTTTGTATAVSRTRPVVAPGDSNALGTGITSTALNLVGNGNATTTGTATALTESPIVAGGTADTDTTAITSTTRPIAGVGVSIAEARTTVIITTAETVTVSPRSSREGEPVEIAGQLNIAGQLEVGPGGAALDAERTLTSSGLGEAIGTGVKSELESNFAAAGSVNMDLSAAPTASRAILGGGVANATARSTLPIPTTEALTIGPRSGRQGEPVEIGGQLNIAGQLEMSPDGAALDAAVEPTAFGELTATGSAASVDTKLLFAASGIADTTAAAVVSPTRSFDAAGGANAVGSVSLTAGRRFSGEGFADALGDGEIDIELLLDAALSVSATGTAIPSTIVPVIRADNPSIGWQEDEETTIGWQEDEAVTVGWQEDEETTIGWQEDEAVTVGWQEDEDVSLSLDDLDG